MKILLNPQESEEYLVYLENKKHSTSMRDLFPTVKEMCDDKSPKGCKLRPVTIWPSHHKTEIMDMVAAGKFPREIAKELGMNESSVKHLVYTEKKARRKLAEAKAELSEYRTSGKNLDHIEKASQKLATDDSAKPIVIPSKEDEKPSRTITEALREMVVRGCSVVFMMTALNQEFGTQFTKDDIVKMRSEL